MSGIPKNLLDKLDDRRASQAYRKLSNVGDRVDFTSNDYLGLANDPDIFHKATDLVLNGNKSLNGATGSRLLSGESELVNDLENLLARVFETPGALVFNSGYNANIGLLSTIPQRQDIILFDEYCHASIRDGIQLGRAKAFKFKHNDITDLKDQIIGLRERSGQADDIQIYVVTESVFSMDGDSPDIRALVELCREHKCHLILDEAHAIGVVGKDGLGLAGAGTEDLIFARIITFGKAMGCHGAAVLGSTELREYLINYCRTFIYTTALPPHSVATILETSEFLFSERSATLRQKLQTQISHFRHEVESFGLKPYFVDSTSAIHSCIIPGNQRVKAIALELQNMGFDVRPILSPTVPLGKERLRICVHSYNTETEITSLLNKLEGLLNEHE